MKEIVMYVLGEVNHLAVFVAALANFFLGAIWFSPLMFAKSWSRMTFGDVDMDEVKKKVNMGYTMGMAFVATWLTAYAISVPIVIMELMQFDLKLILLFAVYLTGGFMIMNMYKHSLFEMKSFKLVLINGSHDLIVMMLMAAIIALMQDPDVEKFKEMLMKMLER